MSTRSVIGIIRKDGKIECISCHYDGYLHGVGDMLLNHYMVQDKIEKLLELGDISTLKENVEPVKGVQHSFKNPDAHTTIAYGRDRGDKHTASVVVENLNQFQKEFNDSWCEYAYLFDEVKQKWFCNSTVILTADDMEELSIAIKKEMNESMDYGMKFN